MSVTASEMDVILEVECDALASAGFDKPSARPRRWVRARPPVREVFELAALKGATLVPRWGLSLDFVPHVEGGRLRWHRTDQSARLDVVYDPVDFHADWKRQWAISMIHDTETVRRNSKSVVSRAIARALEWFAEAATMGLLATIERHRNAEWAGRRFGFDNWVQQPLALAFVLAQSGRTDDARAALDQWMGNHVPDEETQQQLVALLSR